MKRRLSVTGADLAVLALCLALIFAFAGFSDRGVRAGYLSVQSPFGTYRYSLDRDDRFSVRGLLGNTVVQISDRTVRVLSDPGPRKISVRHKPISRSGEWIASLPNQVLLTVVSADAKVAGTIDDVAF